MDKHMWNKYVESVKARLEIILHNQEGSCQVDLHMHTKYSADGELSVHDLLRYARQKQLKIISVTDHDSISAYEEIITFYFENDEADMYPVVIPGVEFTLFNGSYGSMFHVLKYFFDPYDASFIQILQQNQQAYWNRAIIQFNRIQENAALQELFLKHGIDCTYRGYETFLSFHTIQIPEYSTLACYLYSLLEPKGVSVWDVFEKVVYYTRIDSCVMRKRKKEEALARFYEKYRKQARLDSLQLLPILAIVGVDDDIYYPHKSSGSLSVDEYGQIEIGQLATSGVNVIAHPKSESLNLLAEMSHILSGIEINYLSSDETNSKVLAKASDLNMFLTVGSDFHRISNRLHNDMEFYRYSYYRLEALLRVLENK